MTTETIINKRRTVGAIMARCNLLQHKDSILVAYGTDSIKELSETQLDDLISELTTMERNRTDAPPALRKQRSNVLALLDDLGIKPQKGDWSAVNDFLKSPRISGKVLYMMTEQELKDCAKRIRAYTKKKAEHTEQENHIANNN